MTLENVARARNLLASKNGHWTPLKFIFGWYIILDGYQIGKSSAPREICWRISLKNGHWTPLKFIFRWYMVLDDYHIGKSSGPQARYFLAYFFEKMAIGP